MFRLVMRVALAAAALAAAGRELFRPGAAVPSRREEAPPPSRLRLMVQTSLATALVLLFLGAAGGFVVMSSGVYNIAATQPHFEVVRWFLSTGRTRSVEFQSRHIEAPSLRNAALVREGLTLYRIHCETCHGAPGVGPAQMGRGINPNPPPLVTAAGAWTDSQLYWIVAHGLKMSGMPEFGVRLGERDRWAVVAFVRRMQLLSPAGYARFVNVQERGAEDPELAWIPPGDFGFSQLRNQGNPARGRTLMQDYGCLACHRLPGVSFGDVGPPLTAFSERHFIAGSSVNVPDTVIDWIVDPQRHRPNTIMPNLGVKPDEARHMVAYLYTLGDSERIERLEQALAP